MKNSSSAIVKDFSVEELENGVAPWVMSLPTEPLQPGQFPWGFELPVMCQEIAMAIEPAKPTENPEAVLLDLWCMPKGGSFEIFGLTISRPKNWKKPPARYGVVWAGGIAFFTSPRAAIDFWDATAAQMGFLRPLPASEPVSEPDRARA